MTTKMSNGLAEAVDRLVDAMRALYAILLREAGSPRVAQASFLRCLKMAMRRVVE